MTREMLLPRRPRRRLELALCSLTLSSVVVVVASAVDGSCTRTAFTLSALHLSQQPSLMVTNYCNSARRLLSVISQSVCLSVCLSVVQTSVLKTNHHVQTKGRTDGLIIIIIITGPPTRSVGGPVIIYRSASLVTVCGDVCQTLESLLVSSPELAHLRTVNFHYINVLIIIIIIIIIINVKKLNSLKRLVRTTVAMSHN